MSNGIGKNPLNDISKVYLEQIVEKKKDDTYLEPDMKKRQANNEKARKDMEKMGTKMKNPHFESAEKSGWDAVNSLSDAYKDMQKEGYGAPGHNPGSGEKSVARAKALMNKQGRKGAPGLDAMAAAKKEHEARRGVKKEEVEVAEADSLAAMQARREKRLAAQRKREGTTASGRDFGHAYSLSDKQQNARRDAEFKAGLGTKKEEVEVAEADDPKSDAMLAKKKQMLQKQYMLDKMRMQMQKQGKLPMGSQRSGSAMESTESNIDEKINPLLKSILKKTPKGEDPEKGGVPYKRTGKMTEGLSVDDQMRISRDAAKGRNPNPDHKAIRGKMLRKPLPKDTRTDAQKMTDATGPRPGSRYRGD